MVCVNRWRACYAHCYGATFLYITILEVIYVIFEDNRAYLSASFHSFNDIQRQTLSNFLRDTGYIYS